MKIGRNEIDFSYRIKDLAEIEQLMKLADRKKTPLSYFTLGYIFVALMLLLGFVMTVTIDPLSYAITPEEILSWTFVYIWLEILLLLIYAICYKFFATKPEEEEE